MIDVKKILIKYGYNGDNIDKLQRWEKIELLRELSNKLGKDVENNDDVKALLFFIKIYRKKFYNMLEAFEKLPKCSEKNIKKILIAFS